MRPGTPAVDPTGLCRPSVLSVPVPCGRPGQAVCRLNRPLQSARVAPSHDESGRGTGGIKNRNRRPPRLPSEGFWQGSTIEVHLLQSKREPTVGFSVPTNYLDPHRPFRIMHLLWWSRIIRGRLKYGLTMISLYFPVELTRSYQVGFPYLNPNTDQPWII